MEFTPLLHTLTRIFVSNPLIRKPAAPLTIMILSPHPDDEAITGSLPLRFLLENNAHVVNVAVTLGSKEERKKERLKELEAACEVLDFELVVLAENWKTKEKELKSLIQKYQPQILMAPHLKDHHPTHIKTGELLKKCLPKKTDLIVVWTEFWGAMKDPNLLLEVPVEVVDLQMRALEKHAGEVSRNPYHLRLPGWMMDNVRRGSELIAGKGEEAPNFAFGVLYKCQRLTNGKLTPLKLPSPFLSSFADLAEIFR